MRKSSCRRALSVALSALVLAGVGAGPFAGTASAAPTKKPKTITDLVLTAAVPDGAGGTTAITSGGSTRQSSITFTFSSAVVGAKYTCRRDALASAACTSPKSYSALTTGTHTFRLTEAARGYRTKNVTFTWSVDVTPPPAVTFNAITSPSKNPVAITFTGEANDTFSCVIDGGASAPCTPGNTGTSAVTAEGTHILGVTPTDAAGNVGPLASAQWIIDKTGPDVVIQDPPASTNNLASNLVHFSVSGADAATHAVQCKLQRSGGPPASFADCTSPYTATTGIDGTYTLTVRATDAAANSTDAVATWVRDTSAPSTPVVTGPSSPTKTVPAAFTWPAVVGAVSYQCALDTTNDASFVACSSGVTSAVATQGKHTLYVRAVDGANNKSAAAGWTWIVDTIPPSLSVSGVPAGVTNVPSVVPVIVVTDANPLDATCELAGPSASSTCGPYNGLADGDYTLTVNDSDQAGNSATEVVKQFSVDTVGPTASVAKPKTLVGPAVVTYDGPVTGAPAGTAGITLTDSSKPVPSTVTCYSGTTKVVCSASHTSLRITPKQPLVPGQHYTAGVVAGSATDAAGNPAAATSVSFRGIRTLSETSVANHYSWGQVTSNAAYGHSYRHESSRGAKAKFAFRGKTLTWFTRTGPSQGLAYLLVDGKRRATVNNYAPATHNKVARKVGNLGAGKHVATVFVRGLKGSKAGKGTDVAVDAFRTATTLVATPKLVVNWGQLNNAKLTGGHAAYSSTKGATVSLTFRGVSVTWYAPGGPLFGRARIYVDGALKQTVDSYAVTGTFGIPHAVSGLTDKVHTMKIVVLGTHRAAAKGSNVAIDRIQVG